MSQVYDSNARTNQHIREIIQKSDLTNIELSQIYNINVKTVGKHKQRDFTEDKSSRPHNIKTTLTSLEKELIKVIRTMTWMELDDLSDTIANLIPNANRSNVYRTLKSFDINKVPQEQKEKAKKFKEYEPEFLHIDVTYLPKFDGHKYYLFVSIDSARRLLYYKVYENKSSENASEFLKECKDFFPFYLTHILTDKGLEFTDKWARGKGVISGNHRFDVECKEDDIEHRLKALYTP